ncbi:glycosyltransferase [Cerasicoccus arenae]|uniref:UDP-4-amino-4-deoxy-L-arabinose-oxoglutarate aminotransferase n=1 Tax=Cerasicoccus arenae TaxID=424488 RepID=A0A8J3DEI0_9BACT|nr:glycosyltransferase [Cerasicoccus arenae]MBK1857005.1 glycosyltransferase [Cerasicoccus arenae]GHB90340.1 UDP-4-amino-4-deoxy-L-arabinose-oxoglutarate aminotransferase [Cerasicoccus arenae]
MAKIYCSIVIPVYNEEANLAALFDRLTATMDKDGRPWEVIFTNDGSRDRSGELLREFYEQRPRTVRVIDFNGNFGQHMAIMAAFERVRGEVIVTLDADLQNPPEEIPKLLALYDQGFDAVGGKRKNRQDSVGRRYASKLINFMREWTTDIRMSDQGCMLRAYSRRVVDAISRSGERATFIPALAYKFAAKPGEVEVVHAERAAGESKYNYYKLIRLNFDLVTGFTLVPLQLFTLFSMLCAGGSLALVIVLALRRLIIGPEEGGLFTLFGILFFLVSVCMVGIGLIGEYVGRAYQCVQQRPRYVLKELLEDLSDE